MLPVRMFSGVGDASQWSSRSFQVLTLRRHSGFFTMIPPGQGGTPMAISWPLNSWAKASSWRSSPSDRSSA